VCRLGASHAIVGFPDMIGPRARKSPHPGKTHRNTRRISYPLEEGVQLEVLDWGGSGRPVVLLTGSRNTAHVYDDFAPKLSDCCHVYAITRRGWRRPSPCEPQQTLRARIDRLPDPIKGVWPPLLAKLHQPMTNEYRASRVV